MTAQASYTWGHNLDEVTAYRGALPQDSYDFKDNLPGIGRLRNSISIRATRFKGYLNYLIPSAQRIEAADRRMGMNTAFAFNGGQPITVYNGDDTSGTDEFTQRVNQVANPFAGISHSIQTVNGSKFVQWFNAAAYVEPPANTWGTDARNSIYGPGYSDVRSLSVKEY